MELAAVFALSIFAMKCMQGFKVNVFNVDDNSMQFYPIIQKRFETLIETGHLPIYDFYEMQGTIVQSDKVQRVIDIINSDGRINALIKWC